MNSYLHASAWLFAAVLCGAVFLWLGSDNGGADIAAYWLGPQGPAMMTSIGYHVVQCVLAAVALRVTLKGFDQAIALNFKDVIENCRSVSHVLPILNYTGARFVGLSIMFGLIFSS